MGTVAWTVMTIVGLILGVGLGFWLGRLHRTSDTEKLGEVEAELEDYKQRVTEHFSQAATHFHAIGRQYRELYEHMANGSQDLCKLDQVEGALFSLEQNPAPPQDRQATEGVATAPVAGDDPEVDENTEKPDTTAAPQRPEAAETADEPPRDYAVEDKAEASGDDEPANKAKGADHGEAAQAGDSGPAAGSDGDTAPADGDEAQRQAGTGSDTPPEQVLEKAAEQAADTEPEPEERTYH